MIQQKVLSGIYLYYCTICMTRLASHFMTSTRANLCISVFVMTYIVLTYTQHTCISTQRYLHVGVFQFFCHKVQWVPALTKHTNKHG